MTISINSVKTIIAKSQKYDSPVGLLQDDTGKNIAEIWWDGATKSGFLKMLTDSQQVTCVGESNLIKRYANNTPNLKVGDPFLFTLPVDLVVNSDYWSNNCSIKLDADRYLSFDFNITSVSNDDYQLLSNALVVSRV